jgi:hypothetical protein
MIKLFSSCQYEDHQGNHCPSEAGSNGYCYWHDESICKNNPADKKELEQFVRAHQHAQGLSLKRAELSDIHLVNHNHKQGFDLSYSDLYRANLSGAHLFNINLSHASLMKADLRHANLHCANLKGCNLLGVKWQRAKIENMDIGESLLQEELAHKALKRNDHELALDYLQQAEEIYRDLRKAAEHEGIFTMAGHFIVKELTMRRYQLPMYSLRRLFSKVVDLFCGYGEAPLRVVGFSILLILLCAILYFFTGINYSGEQLQFYSGMGIADGLRLFFSCLYYSVVTFTTLGYGDITPLGLSRLIAAVEAFTGSFTIALFVVVFVKKMTR